MNAQPALLTRPASPPGPVSADPELDLSALLELFSPDVPPAVPVHRALRSAADRLWAGVQTWSERAAQWGAVPGVPAVPDTRSSGHAAEGGQ